MAAIFDLSLTPMSDSIHTSPAVLLDPKHVDVAFGILLIALIKAEILHCFIATSGFWQPSLICDSNQHRCFLISSVVFLDHKNAVLVLGFQFVSCFFLLLFSQFFIPASSRVAILISNSYSRQLYVIEVQFGPPTVH